MSSRCAHSFRNNFCYPGLKVSQTEKNTCNNVQSVHVFGALGWRFKGFVSHEIIIG